MARIERSEDCRARHRATLLEYLSNPDNRPLTRKDMSTEALGFADGSIIYQVFTPEEIRDIEHEALELRRKCYASKLAQVDDGLIKKAIAGDSAAAKLCFQRYESWSEKSIQELKLDGPMLQAIFNFFPPEVAAKLKMALIAKHRELT